RIGEQAPPRQHSFARARRRRTLHSGRSAVSLRREPSGHRTHSVGTPRERPYAVSNRPAHCVARRAGRRTQNRAARRRLQSRRRRRSRESRGAHRGDVARTGLHHRDLRSARQAVPPSAGARRRACGRRCRRRRAGNGALVFQRDSPGAVAAADALAALGRHPQLLRCRAVAREGFRVLLAGPLAPRRAGRGFGGGMNLLRRLALGFPTDWSHRRGWSIEAVRNPGAAPYFVEWNPGSGVYGEDFIGAPRDADGALLFGAARSRHPIRIAQFGLHRYAVWQATGDPQARDDFFAQARWFRDTVHDGPVPGLYVFNFPWEKYGASSGWTSAMGQGEAISVLLLADHHDPGAGFSEAALRAAQPFRWEIAQGGVVWRSGDDVFFEEVANAHAPHILNGCI